MTIITPTYNRGYILKNAFNSLCRQSDREFEWIIVDDGSTDNTEEIVKGWMDKDVFFTIRYYKQKNGGKHRAVNKGVKEAKYDYALILDSDDYLSDDAVEKIHSWVKDVNDREDFAGVAGLRGWMNNDGCIGGAGKDPYFTDCKNTERGKFNLLGDKAEVYKIDILRKYPFPEFEGENFLSEHVVWDRIAKDGYKLRWFNEIIYYCEYLSDGLTKSTSYKLVMNNFQGFVLSTKIKLELESFPMSYFAIGLFNHIAKMKGIKQNEARQILGVSCFKLFSGKVIFMLNEIKKKFIRVFQRS